MSYLIHVAQNIEGSNDPSFVSSRIQQYSPAITQVSLQESKAFIAIGQFEFLIEIDDMTNIEDAIKIFNTNAHELEITEYYDQIRSCWINTTDLYGTSFEKKVVSLPLLEDAKPDDINSLSKKTLEEYLSYENKKGLSFYRKKNYKDALSAFRISYHYSIKLGNDSIHNERVATCMYNMGSCYYGLEDYISARKYLNQAILIYKRLPSKKNDILLKYLNKYSSVLMTLGVYEDAYPILTEMKKYSSLEQIEKYDIVSKLSICDIQITDYLPSLRSNPYSSSSHKNIYGNGNSYCAETCTVTKRNAAGVIASKETFNFWVTPLKYPDPAKKQTALEHAHDARVKGQNERFQRIIMAYPLEERDDFFEYLEKHGIFSSRRTDRGEPKPQRPLTEDDSLKGDPHIQLLKPLA